jgi:hypothetical protein
MAQRYRERTPETGDIADPRDLMDNLSTLVGEFNGGLDSNNLPDQAITSAMVLFNAFTQVTGDPQPSSSVAFDGETTEWRNKNDSGATINELDVPCNTDTLLEVEWSATWSRTGSSAGDYADGEMTAFRLLIDGAVVAHLPRSPRSRSHDSGYLIGHAPVQGGKHRVSVEIRQWVIDSDRAHEKTTVINERELVVRAYKR